MSRRPVDVFLDCSPNFAADRAISGIGELRYRSGEIGWNLGGDRNEVSLVF